MNKVDLTLLDKKLKKVAGLKQAVMPKAFDTFYYTTPVRTGDARRNTRLQKDVIKADYAYASRLDEGYSRQAPKGMSEPTIKVFNKLVKAFLKSIGK